MVTSRRFFRNLADDFEVHWYLEVNGKRVKDGLLSVSAEPWQTVEFTVDVGEESRYGASYITFELLYRNATPWAEKGFSAGFRQLCLNGTRYTALELPAAKQEVVTAKKGDSVTVSVGDTAYTFDLRHGSLSSILDNDKELLAEPAHFSVWRAPTDNDRNIRREWENCGFDRLKERCVSAEVTESDADRAVITAELALAPLSGKPYLYIRAIYTVDCLGGLSVRCDGKVEPKLPFLPRFGMDLVMRKETERITFFGYGPGDCYSDKNLSSRKALFSLAIPDNYEHAIKPQESGNHYGTEFAELTSLTGHGLRITSEQDFELNALPYSVEQLTATTHDCELVPTGLTYVSVNYRQSGIGSNSCGPKLPEKHRLSETEFSYRFRLCPVTK